MPLVDILLIEYSNFRRKFLGIMKVENGSSNYLLEQDTGVPNAREYSLNLISGMVISQIVGAICVMYLSLSSMTIRLVVH